MPTRIGMALNLGAAGEATKFRLGSRRRKYSRAFAYFGEVLARSSEFDQTSHRVLDGLLSEADGEWLTIDSTIIRAHQHAVGAKPDIFTRTVSSRNDLTLLPSGGGPYIVVVNPQRTGLGNELCPQGRQTFQSVRLPLPDQWPLWRRSIIAAWRKGKFRVACKSEVDEQLSYANELSS